MSLEGAMRVWLSRLWHRWRRRRRALTYPLLYRRVEAQDEPAVPPTKTPDDPADAHKQQKPEG